MGDGEKSASVAIGVLNMDGNSGIRKYFLATLTLTT